MDPFTIFMAATAIFSGVSTVENLRSRRANRRAQELQQESQNYKASMERRQATRQRMMAYATAQQNSENQGVGTSSGASGGQGSIFSQGNANLAFINNNMAYANKIGSFLDDASKHSSMAGMWGGLANFASAGMNMAPTPDWLKPTPPRDAQLPSTITSPGVKGPWG